MHVRSDRAVGGLGVDERAKQVRTVLWRVLYLNVAVALAKLGWGLFTGSTAMAADGAHSLFDGASNVIALVGLAFAARPADDDHPYGHTKYETYAALGIGVMLSIAAYSIVTRAIAQLAGASAPPEVTATSYVVMFVTVAVNLTVTTYERTMGKRLRSEALLADASHTASDVLVSVGVLVSLALVQLGFPQADPFVSLGIAAVIGYTAWGILRRANQTLTDTARIAPEEIQGCVSHLSEVLDVHRVRTRGTESYVLVDLHVTVDPTLTVARSHHVAHEVETCIREKFPEVSDVVVHIEPGIENGGTVEYI